MTLDWLAIARGVAQQLDSPTMAIYWLYLLTAGAIALAVYWRRFPGPRRNVRGFLRFVFPPHPAWRRSWHDVAVFVINTVAYSLLFFSTVQLISTTVAQRVWLILHDSLGPVGSPWTGPAARVAMTICVLIVTDLAFFASHWLQHRVGWLWEFHKVHHSAQVLHPFTVARRHPVDAAAEASIIAAALGALYGLSGWLSDGALDSVRILGVNALLFVFLLTFNLQHSHVWLSYGRLDRVFISPAAHQLHHSSDPRHFGNYGNVLALWDWIFGTLVRRSDIEQLRVGLHGQEDLEYTSMLRLYLWPFVKLARRIASLRSDQTER
jgi:sterol desaturase/sphingolipid hydroxylase (fatty acid hydroxylase superfamily)